SSFSTRSSFSARSSFRRFRSRTSPRSGEVSRVAEKVLTLPRNRGFDLLRFVPSGRSLLLGLGAVSIAVGLYGLARETSLFAVRSIVVEGAPPAVAADLRTALRSYEGRSLVAVDAGT